MLTLKNVCLILGSFLRIPEVGRPQLMRIAFGEEEEVWRRIYGVQRMGKNRKAFPREDFFYRTI